jgi:hypothetical protein
MCGIFIEIKLEKSIRINVYRKTGWIGLEWIVVNLLCWMDGKTLDAKQ